MLGVINLHHVFFFLKFAYLIFTFLSYFFANLKPYFKLWHIFYVLNKCLLILLASLNYVIGFATFIIIPTCDNVNSHHMLCKHILYFFLILNGFLYFLLGG